MPAVSSIPRLSAWGAFACAFPLVLIGGVVTTIGAGMAVKGWWDAEGYFMPFFPLDLWLRDVATIVEHGHRLWGLLVGLFALLAALSSAFVGAPRAAHKASWIALLAVSVQGWLGGMRVLENSRDLALLHGGFAQLVFTLLGVAALLHGSPAGWAARGQAAAPRAWLWVAAAVVYAQIWLGAWYRHGLRGGEYELDLRFHLHVGGAFVVLALLVVLARRLRRLSQTWQVQGHPAPEAPRRLARRLHLLLGLQLSLGLGAWLGHRGSAGQGTVTVLETVSAVGHVLVGALLLAALISGALAAGWSAAPGQPGAEAQSRPDPGLAVRR